MDTGKTGRVECKPYADQVRWFCDEAEKALYLETTGTPSLVNNEMPSAICKLSVRAILEKHLWIHGMRLVELISPGMSAYLTGVWLQYHVDHLVRPQDRPSVRKRLFQLFGIILLSVVLMILVGFIMRIYVDFLSHWVCALYQLLCAPGTSGPPHGFEYHDLSDATFICTIRSHVDIIFPLLFCVCGAITEFEIIRMHGILPEDVWLHWDRYGPFCLALWLFVSMAYATFVFGLRLLVPVLTSWMSWVYVWIQGTNVV